MNKKEYDLLVGVIGRTKMIAEMDKNALRRHARLNTLNLLATDLTATLNHTYPNFDRERFIKAVGMGG